MLLKVFSTTYTYSNCIVYRLPYDKNNVTNIYSKKSKIGMNLWMVSLAIWKAQESTKDGKKLNNKTTEYLRMKGVSDSIELWMLMRADYMRESNIFGEPQVYSYGTPSVFHNGRENGWADSLLSLAFATRWNPKHPSYVGTRLFCNSISQFSCGEQTIWDVQSYWQVKYQTNTYLKKYIYIYIRYK